MRIVFAGTPAFSVPTLEALIAAGHEPALVVTQPDRPAGRGARLTPPPVKQAAVARGLVVFQPEDVNAPESAGVIREVEPDAMVVIAFGQKLSAELLFIPRLGCYNVHASLLPAYRGAAPVNWAIIRGEAATGVTIIRMNERIDAGEMLARESIAIDPAWTAGDLERALSPVGANVLVRTLADVEAGAARPLVQPKAGLSHAPRLRKEHGLIRWDRPAHEVHDRIRGVTPWPGAYAFIADGRTGKAVRLAVLRSRVEEEDHGTAVEPGTVTAVVKDGIAVACGAGTVVVTEVKPAGGRAMSALDFVHGHGIRTGMRFKQDFGF